MFDEIFDDIEKSFEGSIKEVAPKAVKLIAERQGKFSGQLRASNNLAIDKPNLSKVTVANYVRDAIQGTRALAFHNAKRDVKPFKFGQDVHLTNNQDYAIYDEYKHGRLAYEGATDYLPEAIERAFK